MAEETGTEIFDEFAQACEIITMAGLHLCDFIDMSVTTPKERFAPIFKKAAELLDGDKRTVSESIVQFQNSNFHTGE